MRDSVRDALAQAIVDAETWLGELRRAYEVLFPGLAKQEENHRPLKVFWEKVRARRAQGVSLETIAKQIGINPVTIYAWKKNGKVSEESLEKIQRWLDE